MGNKSKYRQKQDSDEGKRRVSPDFLLPRLQEQVGEDAKEKIKLVSYAEELEAEIAALRQALDEANAALEASTKTDDTPKEETK